MYRKIDLSKWEKVGRGSNASLYISKEDPGLALKLNVKNIAVEQFVKKEFDVARKVMGLGLATPEAKEIVQIDDSRIGIIFEYIKNKKSFSRIIVDDQEHIEDYVKEFVAKAKELHSTPCDTTLFKNKTFFIREGIKNAKFLKKYKPCLYKLCDEMEGKTTCLHGDLQTGNLIKANDKIYWIDLEKFSYGDPIMDIAHMYTIYKGMSWFFYIQNLLHMKKKLLNKFWNLFLKEYFNADEEEIKKINKKLPIYNAIDLLQKNYTHKGLYADLVTFILARPTIKRYYKSLK